MYKHSSNSPKWQKHILNTDSVIILVKLPVASNDCARLIIISAEKTFLSHLVFPSHVVWSRGLKTFCVCVCVGLCVCVSRILHQVTGPQVGLIPCNDPWIPVVPSIQRTVIFLEQSFLFDIDSSLLPRNFK